jgi:hypothetical protein
MGEPQRPIYTPHPDATAETEAAALSTVYRFLLLSRMRVTTETGTRSSQSHTRKEVPDEPLRNKPSTES